MTHEQKIKIVQYLQYKNVICIERIPLYKTWEEYFEIYYNHIHIGSYTKDIMVFVKRYSGILLEHYHPYIN